MIGLWPQSMLGRNLLLLISSLLVGQVSVAAIWFIFVMRPRIDEAAAVVVSQIVLADKLLTALPPSERRTQLVEMSGVQETALPPSTLLTQPPKGVYLARRFFERLVAELPAGVQLRWQVDPVPRLWVRLRASDQYWLALPEDRTATSFEVSAALAMLLALTAFPAIGAYLIHRRIEEPLRRLAGAAAEVEQGQWPEAVSLKGPSELVKVTEAFNRMMAALSEAESMREEMLAGISHDIRTPLTKLRMIVSAPEAFEGDPSVGAERYIEDIDAIVGQFVDFVRGAETEAPETGDVNALVEDLALDYAGLGHHFDLDLQPHPPIKFRPISMQRVLMNVMQNAASYGQIGLAVRTRGEGKWLLVSVLDRGPGLSDDQLSLVKQPFRRGSRPSGKGSGLGLAIAERIAKQHGGSIELAHRIGGGLDATVRLPCA